MNKVKLESILLVPSRNGLCKAKAIRGNGAKMVSMGNVFAHSRINVDSIQMERVPLEENEKINFSIINNDLLFARRSLTFDGAGKCSIVKNCSDTTVFESSMIRLRIDTTKAIPDYIFYYFNSIHGINNIRTIVEQVAVAGIRGSDLVKLEVPCPDIPTQEKIASVLQDFDNKIELNNKINENLQQQAQALFKSWFVDFEPWGGIMPENWGLGTLNDILLLERRTIKKGEKTNLPYLPIDIIPMNSFSLNQFRPSSEAQSSLVEFKKDDILIGAMRVYFHRVTIAPCDGITRTTCFTLKSKKDFFRCFALLCCNQDACIEYAQNSSKGTTMPYAVWENGMSDFCIPLPNDNVLKEFEHKISPIVSTIMTNCSENRHLSQLRDALLPKLMSGELDVSSIDL